MTQVELKRVCIKCGGLGHQAVWKLKGGGLSRCRTFNNIPTEISKQMKYPHLGNVSLHEIRQKILKEVKSPAEAAVADVSEYTSLATDGAGHPPTTTMNCLNSWAISVLINRPARMKMPMMTMRTTTSQPLILHWITRPQPYSAAHAQQKRMSESFMTSHAP